MSTLVKSLRIDPELWAFVERRAKAKDISPNKWLIRCIEDARKRLEAEAGKPGLSRLKKR